MSLNFNLNRVQGVMEDEKRYTMSCTCTMEENVQSSYKLWLGRYSNGQEDEKRYTCIQSKCKQVYMKTEYSPAVVVQVVMDKV